MNSSTLKRSLAVIPVVLGFGSLFLTFSSCEKSVDPPIKNPREFVWSIDTLAYPGSFQTEMREIWASSPQDAWIVGHNDQPGPGTMFHFDGKSWKTTGFHSAEGGSISGPVSLHAIYGFSANSIFAVGERIYQNPKPPPNFLDSSLIIHFDGRQWREENIPAGRGLWSIFAVSPIEIWACGTGGTLVHFDGTLWKRDSVALSVPNDGQYTLWDIKVGISGKIYMMGRVHQNSLARTTTYLFVRQQNRWSLADSFFVEPGHADVKFGQNNLWVSPEGTLYSFGPHIFRWTGSSWVKVYDILDALRRMAGTSNNNVFAVGDFGNVLHYNGVDWYQFKELKNSNVVYSSVWTDGKEVVVVGYFNDGSKTLILHGK